MVEIAVAAVAVADMTTVIAEVVVDMTTQSVAMVVVADTN